MKKKKSPLCSSTDCANVATTQCALRLGRSLAQTLLWLSTVPARTRRFHQTTSQQHRHPEQRDGRGLSPNRLGVCSLLPPSSLLQGRAIATRRPPSRRPVPVQQRHHRCVDGQQCPVEYGQSIDNDLKAPCVGGLPLSMSRLLTMTFVDTRPPHSPYTCAAARSSAKPFAPKNPASAHAARWWPQQSRRRSDRQVWEEKGKGRWRRRNSRGPDSSLPILPTS